MIHLRGHHLELLYGYITAYDNEFSLNNKQDSIISTAIHEHSKNHGLNIIQILEKAMNPDEKIRIIDTIDDICATCNFKNRTACKEFIPYGVSSTCEDRGYLHFYGLKKREYTAEFIQKRLKEKGSF